MIVDSLNIKDNLEEILSHSAKPFPHTSYYVEPLKYPGGYIPWHWHRDVEFIYIVQGTIKLTTNMDEYILNAGEAAFINTNVLHLQVPERHSSVITLNQVFDSSLIAGAPVSIYARKYVEPILTCQDIDVMIFHPSNVQHRKIIESIRQAQDVSDAQEYGYEMWVRNYLSAAWVLIFQEAEEKIRTAKTPNPAIEERLKKMMLYIQEHYMDKISLGDIAGSASISEREALRTFKTNLHMTPFSYLLEYRSRMAAGQLAGTDHPVSQIAYDCGFSSASYFGKVFREAMGCTALEYRKISQKNI